MKKFLLGSVGLAAMIAGPAVAADMPLKAPPPVAIFSWTGCYVGAHVGGKASDSDVRYGNGNPAFAGSGGPAAGKIHMSGALGGGQIGCNYQVGTWVFGIEGDGSAVQSDGAGYETFPGRTTFRDQTTEHWLATARGRLGYATDKWLLYVTGGGAWADLQTTVSPAVTPVLGLAAIQKNTLSGWTVGVGAEYALGYGWSIKGEYLYIDFSSSNYFSPTTPFGGAGGILGTDYNVRLRQSVARFGMNYKFDWGGPVVAKY